MNTPTEGRAGAAECDRSLVNGAGEAQDEEEMPVAIKHLVVAVQKQVEFVAQAVSDAPSAFYRCCTPYG